jgi:hypothetical protein
MDRADSRHPGAAGAVGGPPPPGARRACAPPPAWWWRPARRARCTTSRCWPATAPRPCTPTWRWRRWPRCHELPASCGREGDLQLRQGHRQGPVEDHVQDGHLAPTCRTAARRSSRPSACRRTGREVLPRHRHAGRRHRRVRGGRRSAAHAPRRLRQRPGAGQHARRRRRIRLAHRGEEHMWTPDAIAKLQHSTRAGKFDTYKEYAQIINDQSKRHMTLRGLFEFKLDPARRSRWTRSSPPSRDRQALRHRRDVAGLDLHRGAHHAGHRHEPHRRQEQHRRRRRGPGALPQRAQGHPHQGGAPRCPTSSAPSRHRATTS